MCCCCCNFLRCHAATALYARIQELKRQAIWTRHTLGRLQSMRVRGTVSLHSHTKNMGGCGRFAGCRCVCCSGVRVAGISTGVARSCRPLLALCAFGDGKRGARDDASTLTAGDECKLQSAAGGGNAASEASHSKKQQKKSRAPGQI